MAAGVVAKAGDKLVVCFLREDDTAQALLEKDRVRVYVDGIYRVLYCVKNLNRSLAGDATIVPAEVHKVLEQSVARQPRKG